MIKGKVIGSEMYIVNSYKVVNETTTFIEIEINYDILNNQDHFIKIRTETILKKYKIVLADELYKLVHNKKSINYTPKAIKKDDKGQISGFYIKEFSKKGYELKYKEQMPPLEEFCLKHAFLNSDNVNFSNVVFEKNVTLSNCIFSNNNLFFNKCKFCNGANFKETNFGIGTVLFNNSTFLKGNVIFFNAYFNRGGVQFDNVDFKDSNVNFQNTVFGRFYKGIIQCEEEFIFTNVKQNHGEMYFYNSYIGNARAYFDYTDFGKGVTTFTSSTFGNSLKSFKYCVFRNEGNYFTRTNFNNGDVNFTKAKFLTGEISFCETNFGQSKVTFDKTDFGNCNINFNSASIQNNEIKFSKIAFSGGRVSLEKFNADNSYITFDDCILKSHLDLRIEHFKGLRLNNCTIENIINLNYKTDDTTEFIDLSDTIILGNIQISWRKNHLKKLIINDYNSPIDKIIGQLRMLKENFNKLGQYQDEDECYLALKRENRKYKYKTSKNKCFGILAKFLEYVFVDLTGGYGTKPKTTLLSLLVMIILFSFVYTYIPYCEFDNGNNVASSNIKISTTINLSEKNSEIKNTIDEDFSSLSTSNMHLNFIDGLYYSGITSLTIGYGDIHPANILTKILSIIEGFFGIITTAYFTICFSRKIIR